MSDSQNKNCGTKIRNKNCGTKNCRTKNGGDLGHWVMGKCKRSEEQKQWSKIGEDPQGHQVPGHKGQWNKNCITKTAE